MNRENDSCQCTVIHQDVVEKVKDKMIQEETLIDLGDFFKVMGDGTRLRILNALMESELCVCDIAALLSMSQSSISHQLRILKQARLVKYRKEGKVVYYSLDDDHVKEIFNQGLVHIKHR